MYRPFFALAALASILTLPAAHADTIDDFLLTGGGHTISYSLPATTTYPYGPSLEFFYATATATIDGVPGYAMQGGYDAIPSTIGTLQLFVPEAIFGYPQILFQGPLLVSTELVPSDDPFNQFAYASTFLPGTYSLIGNGMFPGGSAGPDVPYTLAITPQTPAAATPEPSSLILLGTGVFGLLGFAAIRRGRIKRTHEPHLTRFEAL
jgi:hypothetical protein